MKDPFEGALKYLEEIGNESLADAENASLYAPPDLSSNDIQPDITEGRVVAIKICSHVLNGCFWLALEEDFKTDDGLAVFYGSEIPLLRAKSEESLRKIHELRLIFNGGRVLDPDQLQ